MPDNDISAELCEQVRRAHAEQSGLEIRGASSKPWRRMDAGRASLQAVRHSGIVSHDPTELVVTVRAGTTLVALDQALAERGQMLAAECPDFPGGSTVGGALALGWSGSRRPYAGALRDFVLGCRMVNGLGEPLHFGGRVMKNVAGYDISRLLSGSLGRLGMVLEVSLKLLPLPERELTLQFAFDSLQESRRFVRRVQQAGEPLSAASFHAGCLHLRFSGQAVTLSRLAAELQGREADNDYWCELRNLQLPFFTSAEPGAALYDWNGDVCWSRTDGGGIQRQEGNGAAVELLVGPPDPGAGSDALAELHRRVALAFDPAGVFARAPVAVN